MAKEKPELTPEEQVAKAQKSAAAKVKKARDAQAKAEENATNAIAIAQANLEGNPEFIGKITEKVRADAAAKLRPLVLAAIAQGKVAKADNEALAKTLNKIESLYKRFGVT